MRVVHKGWNRNDGLGVDHASAPSNSFMPDPGSEERAVTAESEV